MVEHGQFAFGSVQSKDTVCLRERSGKGKSPKSGDVTCAVQDGLIILGNDNLMFVKGGLAIVVAEL